MSESLPALTVEAWRAEAVKRFGSDPMQWRFTCPACHHVASVADWRTVKATEGEIAFSCIGRHMKTNREAFVAKPTPGPCNYAGGGLFRLNPQAVINEDGKTHMMFAFAEAA